MFVEDGLVENLGAGLFVAAFVPALRPPWQPARGRSVACRRWSLVSR